VRESTEKMGLSGSARARLDGVRPALGATFLAAYAWSNLAPSSVATGVFLGTGTALYAVSVPWASSFHKGLALVAFVALGAAVVTGRFDAGTFVGGLPDYFGVVAVLLVLSVAGYPLRAAGGGRKRRGARESL
jgi:hypothetical protein